MTGIWASEWELPPLLVLSRHEGWCCLGQLLCPGWSCRTVFSHPVHSGDLVNCREVEGGPTALLIELFFGECPPFAVRRLELPLEYFSLLFGVRNKASFFLQWGDPYVGWLLVLNVSPKAFVLGGLLRVSIFKGCVQVGPVCSLQLALDFSSELFAQDLQFLCALLPHLREDMVPPLDEPANEEWVRSKAYSPWPEPACVGCSHWLPYEECFWTGSTFFQRWQSPSVVPSCQPGQSWLSLVGPSPPSCTVEWVLAPVSSPVGGWSLRSAQHLGQKVSEGPVLLGWAVGC